MLCGVLSEFGGYTYSTLLEEDAEFLRLIAIRNRGREGADDESG